MRQLKADDPVLIAGSEVGSQLGAYGVKGMAAAANHPGSRGNSIAWVDSENMLWLFGGSGFDKNGAAESDLNDLWRWDGTYWTWISGSDVASQLGSYGSKGVGAESNMPGARVDAIAWIDSFDNLWLFGGYGYDKGTSIGRLNDLWLYKRFELAVP